MKSYYQSIFVLLLATSAFGAERPNILLVSIDDLNDWTGCLSGHPQPKTPTIDRLAERGTLFANAHCQSPVCNPSRASLLTGRHPHTSGVYFLSPDLKQAPALKNLDTLPERFARHGYRTLAAGKIFHTGDKRFFQEYGGSMGGFGPRPKKKISQPHGHPLWDWGAYPERDEDMPDYRIAQWAVEKLNAELEDSDTPFFMGVGFYRPHVPMYAPKKWFDLFPRDQVKLPLVRKDDRDDLSAYAIALTNEKHVSPEHAWVESSGEWGHAVQAYLASTAFADHCLGLVLDALDGSPHRDNTIVVLFADHGFHLGEKQRWAKRTIWEDGTRVPLIVVAPGYQKGQRTNKPAQLLDIFPTLLELAGLPADDKQEGHSLVPLMKDPQAEWPHVALSSFGKGNYAVRSEHFRYIRYLDGSPSKASIYTGTYCHTNGLRGVTTNFHGPASRLPKAIANHPLTKRLRIRDDLPTLVELFKQSGYSAAITSKLHVHPVSRFPYDHYIPGNPTYRSVREHFAKAGESGTPVFYFANISQPHRAFRNSDRVDIGIDVNAVEPPPFLPNTEACRKDWTEYLGHCQLADRAVGEVLRGLEASGQKDNTVIVFMGDHGPAYHRGKLSLYDFGIRVPLAFSGPMIRSDVITDQLVSNVDLMPTLLDLCGLKDITPALQHGHSIAPFLRGEIEDTGNEYIFSEIHHGAMVRDDGKGMQERCVYDGRWKLIYRENRTEPRQVNADLKYFHHPNPKAPYQDNRVYDEIASRRKEFPEAFRYLALTDNGVLMPGKALPMFELYDLNDDPWEFSNLAADAAHRNTLKRLLEQLQAWLVQTDDEYTVLKSLSADTDTLLRQLAAFEE